MTGRVLVVVQARLTSSRLPGKAMLSLAGRPTVVLAAQRAGNAGTAVVVATSDEADDDVIAAALAAAGIDVVRGPLEDPLRRFALAAEALDDDDVVVRLTADNVVPDGGLVAWLVDAMRSHEVVYVRLGGDDPALPYGVAAEAFTVAVLRETDELATEAVHREHVTGLMRDRHGDRRLSVPESAARDWSGRRCTVDTFDDYVAMARLLAGVADPVATPWADLCDRLEPAGSLLPPRRPNPIAQGPLVLGTVQLGVPYGAANRGGLPEAAVARAILSTAAGHGVSHVDTARAYGMSEERIGAVIARGLREHLGVITKLTPLDEVPGDAGTGWGRAAVMASVERSLRDLRADRVDALLVHRAADWARPGVRDALCELQTTGVATLIGASLATPDDLAAVLADDACGYVQLPFNVLDRRWTAAAVQQVLAARPDVTVAVRSVFLQGLLVGGAQARWPVNAGVDPALVRERLDELVVQLGRTSPADLCLAYVLGHPWVSSVVVGADTAAQVHEAAELVRRPALAADEIAAVDAALAAGGDELIDPSRWRHA